MVQEPARRCNYPLGDGVTCTATAHTKKAHCGECKRLVDDHSSDCSILAAHTQREATRNAPLPDAIPGRSTGDLAKTAAASPRPCAFKDCGRLVCVGKKNHCTACDGFINGHHDDCPVMTEHRRAAEAATTSQDLYHGALDINAPFLYVQYNLIAEGNHAPVQWYKDSISIINGLRDADLAEHHLLVYEYGDIEGNGHTQGILGVRMKKDVSGHYNDLRAFFVEKLQLPGMYINAKGVATGHKAAGISFIIKNLRSQTAQNIRDACVYFTKQYGDTAQLTDVSKNPITGTPWYSHEELMQMRAVRAC